MGRAARAARAASETGTGRGQHAPARKQAAAAEEAATQSGGTHQHVGHVVVQLLNVLDFEVVLLHEPLHLLARSLHGLHGVHCVLRQAAVTGGRAGQGRAQKVVVGGGRGSGWVPGLEGRAQLLEPK